MRPVHGAGAVTARPSRCASSLLCRRRHPPTSWRAIAPGILAQGPGASNTVDKLRQPRQYRRDLSTKSVGDGYTCSWARYNAWHQSPARCNQQLPYDPIMIPAPITLVALVPNVALTPCARCWHFANVQTDLLRPRQPGRLNTASAKRQWHLHPPCGRAVQEHDRHLHAAHAPTVALSPRCWTWYANTRDTGQPVSAGAYPRR